MTAEEQILNAVDSSQQGESPNFTQWGGGISGGQGDNGGKQPNAAPGAAPRPAALQPAASQSTAAAPTTQTPQAVVQPAQTQPKQSAAQPAKSPYDEYKAKRDKRLNDVIAAMEEMDKTYKMPTKEEQEKEEKKRKRDKLFSAIGDGLSALSNLYFTTQDAPNVNFDYTKNGLSAKSKERWDKLDKEREANRDKHYNILLNKYKMLDDAAKDDRDWMHTIERENIADKRYGDEIAHRDTREGIEDKRYDEKVKYQKGRDAAEDKFRDKQFAEGVRHNKRVEGLQGAQLAFDKQKFNYEQSKDGATFSLGSQGSIYISRDRLNSHNISQVFHLLPADVQASAGEPVYNDFGKLKGYKKATDQDMLDAIGQYSASDTNVQAGLRHIAGRQANNSGGRSLGGEWSGN